jgi:plastocyanin
MQNKSRSVTRRSVLAMAAAAPAVAAIVHPALTSPARAHDPHVTTHLVEIKSLKFVPEEITVAPGDSIVFVNRDFVPHTATGADDSWTTQTLDQDDDEAVLIEAGMTLDYYCVFHPNMKGRIRIIDPGSH